MSINTLYYSIKPLIPRKLQIEARRIAVRNKRIRFSDQWPISSRAARHPSGWKGWPGGRRFALVLTHDVETAKGQDRCRSLIRIEQQLGFRSSFNFVPDDYPVSAELRRHLTDQGFEVGLHGLNHGDMLYRSRDHFLSRAPRINAYLREWGAAGFRSPSMHHNLEWIRDLAIDYDASTFDTDPFEPQPDGLDTIFPVWVPGRGSSRGYVELPYTLPQDFTLFVLLREKNIDIWKRKLDWIAAHGGMALLITHPDYMDFGGAARGNEEYPAARYEELLSYINSRYAGQFWNALPRDVARFWKQTQVTDSPGQPNSGRLTGSANEPAREARSRKKERKIWIDLDNSPHVPFFKPIIRELEKNGYRIMLTARDCSQTCSLADLNHLSYRKVGRHFGKNKLVKAAALLWRAAQLLPIVLRERPDLAISHGSRAQLVVAFLLRIPSVMMADYEHVRGIASPTCIMMPEVIKPGTLCGGSELIQYPGIKEDVYVPSFRPSAGFRKELGIGPNERVVTVRPPANEAHYRNPESEELFRAAINHLGRQANMRIILLPRNERQKDMVLKSWPELCAQKVIMIPDRVVDGLDLIWSSDFVISGGGTMNREAAALGVPVYSIFRGKIGAVDRYLSESGRLTLLKNVADVEKKIALASRPKEQQPGQGNSRTLEAIVNGIVGVFERSST